MPNWRHDVAPQSLNPSTTWHHSMTPQICSCAPGFTVNSGTPCLFLYSLLHDLNTFKREVSRHLFFVFR
ncbi:hypothetical protein E2C01_018522 [Portunus trituberculatus]|uniref:Uncharacterized protein n=1 Tax=Portunus trituberculatus TaxID=210409 RepID=A0A5B7DUN7_PORTR|nr:hypothetical protein [Portunus trituberculatus]